jgi:hypothetical protein
MGAHYKSSHIVRKLSVYYSEKGINQINAHGEVQ